jgi:NADPH-dependent curcumin reductase CurA
MLLRTLYLSVNPANRIAMGETAQYGVPAQLGEVMRGTTLAVVEESNCSGFAPREIVISSGGWQEYSVATGGQKISDSGTPLTAYLSALGTTGATAYFGLLDLGKPLPGETLVVSAAAGAVGSIVGQIGKIKGCRVVGLAGSDEKCRHVVDKFGFDDCINYKQDKLGEALRRACPNGIDIDFENAGGEVLNAILGQINLRARVVLCGLISTYNSPEDTYGPSLTNVLMRRARIEGFIIGDYSSRMDEFARSMSQWLAQGRIKYDVHIEHGLENAIDALNLLFSGGNTGKLLVEVSH